MPDKRLGKGLEALITTHSTEGAERFLDGAVFIDKIIPNRNQPRQEFDTKEMDNLAKSIKRSGILQPMTVREIEDGQFELIAGERRFRAAQSIGLDFVPVYILSVEADVEVRRSESTGMRGAGRKARRRSRASCDASTPDHAAEVRPHHGGRPQRASRACFGSL